MLCVICISRGGSASVSFSEVEERSVDLRHMAAVATQREPTCDVRTSNRTSRGKWPTSTIEVLALIRLEPSIRAEQ